MDVISHFVDTELLVNTINDKFPEPIMPVVSVSLSDEAYGIYLSWKPKMPGQKSERSANLSKCIIAYPELKREIRELNKLNDAKGVTILTLMERINEGDDE
jgi:hypothetical protein